MTLVRLAVESAAAHGLSFLLGTAETHIDAYIALTAGVVHDLKGIRPIEGFFIFALFAADPPRRVLESGRARGYSTEILARCFPAASIISIESERNSSDVEIAAKRLEAIKNVDCKFGDARVAPIAGGGHLQIREHRTHGVKRVRRHDPPRAIIGDKRKPMANRVHRRVDRNRLAIEIDFARLRLARAE